MKRTLLMLAVAVALAGCGDKASNVASPTMPAASATPFTTLAKQVLATAADSAPVEVSNLDVTFADNDDPHAFDDVLPPAV